MRSVLSFHCLNNGVTKTLGVAPLMDNWRNVVILDLTDSLRDSCLEYKGTEPLPSPSVQYFQRLQVFSSTINNTN